MSETIDKAVGILEAMARTRSTISYKEFGERMGLQGKPNAALEVSTTLAEVTTWCKFSGIPNLPVLVVRSSGRERGFPGPGFWGLLENGVASPSPAKMTYPERRALARQLQQEAFDYYTRPQT